MTAGPGSGPFLGTTTRACGGPLPLVLRGRSRFEGEAGDGYFELGGSPLGSPLFGQVVN